MDDLILERYVAGDCSESERAQVEAWLREHPTERSLRLLAAAQRSARDWQTGAEWQRLSARIASAAGSPSEPRQKPSVDRTPRRVPWVWTAAAAVLVISAGMIGLHFRRANPAELANIIAATTGRGEHLTVTLQNGAVALVGPMTSLRATERQGRSDIELLGTARFQVVHDSTRVFVVHARDLETTDLGTDFVVRAYANDAERVVAVYAGSVSARASMGKSSAIAVTLQKGDFGVIDHSGKIIVRHDVDIARLTEWERGRIAFDDRPLRQVAAELMRWFDVDIRIADQRLGNRHVTAVYNASSLESILAALSEGLSLSVTRDGRVITLSDSTRR